MSTVTTKQSVSDVLVKHGTSTRATVDRIMSYWNRADERTCAAGRSWYAVASAHVDTMSESSGVTREHAAAVIAHLSPRTTWARNIAGAYALVETRTAPGCMSANVQRAICALDSDAPLATIHGPKTRSFAKNILGDEQAVTVDMWATLIALGAHDDNEKALGHAGMYDAIAHCYRLAAKRAGVTPAVMQATTWIVARNGRAN